MSGMTIYAIIIASIIGGLMAYTVYKEWRNSKWEAASTVHYTEICEMSEKITHTWYGKNEKIFDKIKLRIYHDGFYFYVEDVRFKLDVSKDKINSWSEYRNSKNAYTFILLVNVNEVIAIYKSLDEFIEKFPTVSSYYVKQTKMKESLKSLQEDFI